MPKSLALRTESKKLQFVRHRFESISNSDALFQLVHGAFVDFHDLCASNTYQMVMVAVIAFSQEFEPRGSIPKIEPFNYSHFFQQPHRTINGCQIAAIFWQSRENLLGTHWMGLAAKQI